MSFTLEKAGRAELECTDINTEEACDKGGSRLPVYGMIILDIE